MLYITPRPHNASSYRTSWIGPLLRGNTFTVGRGKKAFHIHSFHHSSYDRNTYTH